MYINKLFLNFHKMLQNVHLNLWVQELEEIFNLPRNEISFFILVLGESGIHCRKLRGEKRMAIFS